MFDFLARELAASQVLVAVLEPLLRDKRGVRGTKTWSPRFNAERITDADADADADASAGADAAADADARSCASTPGPAPAPPPGPTPEPAPVPTEAVRSRPWRRRRFAQRVQPLAEPVTQRLDSYGTPVAKGSIHPRQSALLLHHRDALCYSHGATDAYRSVDQVLVFLRV